MSNTADLSDINDNTFRIKRRKSMNAKNVLHWIMMSVGIVSALILLMFYHIP